MLKNILPLTRYSSFLFPRSLTLRPFSSSSPQTDVFSDGGKYIEDKRFYPTFNQTQRVKPPFISNTFLRKYLDLPAKRKYRKSNYYAVIKGDLIWHVFDLEGYSMGRVATQIAKVLIGKHRPTYQRDVVNDKDRVIVVNCDNPKLTGKKLMQKKYYKHSGYPGGMKVTPIKAVLESKRPQDVLLHAVSGMLPKIKNRKEHLQYIYTFPNQFHTFHELGLPQFAYAQVPDLNKEFGFDSITPDKYEILMSSPDFSDKILDTSGFQQSEEKLPEWTDNFFPTRQRTHYTGEIRREEWKKKRNERRYRAYYRR